MARRRDPAGDDARYLAARRNGLSLRDIAASEDVSVRTVWLGVNRARETERRPEPPPHAPTFRLVPLFPIDSFTPLSLCPHRGPIRKGSRSCCMICHQSGMDHRKAVHRDPRTDPKPEPKPKPEPAKKKTRKQKRSEQIQGAFGK